MYENKQITEPKWKSWIIQTTTPLFTPDQCRQIIESGRSQKPQQAQVGINKPGGGTDTKKRVTTIRKSFWVWRYTSNRTSSVYRISRRRVL